MSQINKHESFDFSHEMLYPFLKNGFKFLYQGYQVVLKNKKYELSKHSSKLETLIQNDILREALIIQNKAKRKNRDDRNLKFKFKSQAEDIEDETDTKRFDIELIYGLDNEPEIVIECKRLDNSKKIYNYFTDGIEDRFIQKRYSPNLSLAAMIGFIEAGNEEEITKKMHTYLQKKVSTLLNFHLINNESPIYYHEYGNHIFQSVHQRVDKDVIELYHLMMDFTSIIMK